MIRIFVKNSLKGRNVLPTQYPFNCGVLRAFSSFNTLAYDGKNDFYDVLGVKVTDEPKKIKVAYYKLAQKYHPDKQGEGDASKAEEKFKLVNNAYEVLKDEQTKKQYDALRMEAKNPRKKT